MAVSTSRTARILPWILLGLFFLSWGGGTWFDRGSDVRVGVIELIWAVSFTAIALTGLFLARRVPENPIGWLFLVGSALVGLGVTVDEAKEALDLESVPWVLEQTFPLGLVLLFVGLVLFPDGRFPHRTFAFGYLVLLLVSPFATTIWPEDDGGPILLLFVGMAVAGLLFRVIRGDGVVRRQTAGVLLTVVMGLVVITLLSLPPLAGIEGPLGDAIAVGGTLFLTIGVPVAMGLAIVRFRLYDIDRVISRTVSYTLLVGVIGLIFALGAVWLPTQLPGDSSALLVAATTLIAAALFNPLRRRIQRIVDHRFNRARYDAEQVIDEFATSLKSRVDPEGVVAGLEGVVLETMQPAAMAMWIKYE